MKKGEGSSILGYILFLLTLCLLGPTGCSSGQEADLAYINGTIYTVDTDFSTASALAVKAGEFVYVGDDEGVQTHIGAGTEVVDLEGRTIIPGLHDSHLHIRFGERELYPQVPDIRTNLGEWASVEQMQAAIRRALETGEGMRPGPEPRWIVLRGWMSDVWDPPVFRKELLDAAAPDNPVFISRYTHGSGANSKALELAGITRDTPDPEGGHIKKDVSGEPTGEFVERAPPQLTSLIPDVAPYTAEERARNLIEGTQLAIESGLTTIHGASMTGFNQVQERLELYKNGRMKIRINEMVHISAAREMGEPMNYENKFVVRSVKAFADGALGSRGALFREAYSDYPDYFGEPVRTEEELTEISTDALRMGFNVRTHCIGDQANHVAINAYEQAMEATGTGPEEARMSLEHAQVFIPEDIPRLKELNILAAMQPLHATEDMNFAEVRMGQERMNYAYIWSDLIDLGVHLNTGTDYSVSPYNPFYTLHAAITRQDRNNQPAGGWFPEQAMTREEALRAATIESAYAMFAEDIMGSIEVGKLADFVVIPVDYMTVPAEDIWKIEPDQTVIGGEVVFEKPAGE